MREIRLSGSVEGVVRNHDPYSDSRSELVFHMQKLSRPPSACPSVGGGHFEFLKTTPQRVPRPANRQNNSFSQFTATHHLLSLEHPSF
jgi:hypothetical protein